MAQVQIAEAGGRAAGVEDAGESWRGRNSLSRYGEELRRNGGAAFLSISPVENNAEEFSRIVAHSCVDGGGFFYRDAVGH